MLKTRHHTGERVMGKTVSRAFMFESKSTPGNFYETLIYTDDSTSCNCKGWIFNHKCWHIAEAQNVASQPIMKLKKSEALHSMPKAAARSMVLQTKQTETVTTFIFSRSKRVFQLED